MKAPIRALILSLAATVMSQAQAADRMILFTEQFPPYNMTTDGKPFAHKGENITGLCTDIVKAVFTDTGHDYKMKLRNWSYGLGRVRSKANHGIFCTAKTAERTPQFHWVGPIVKIGWTLYAKPGSDIKLNNLQEAAGYRIGGYKDDVMTVFLQNQGIDVMVVNDNSHNPIRLMHDQIDLWIADELSGPYMASDAADVDNLTKVLTFNSAEYYLAINKETPQDLVNSLQSSLNKLRKQGDIESIERIYGR